MLSRGAGPTMRGDRSILTAVAVLAVLALGYLAYAVSSSVHPGPAPPPSAHPQERDS